MKGQIETSLVSDSTAFNEAIEIRPKQYPLVLPLLSRLHKLKFRLNALSFIIFHKVNKLSIKRGYLWNK